MSGKLFRCLIFGLLVVVSRATAADPRTLAGIPGSPDDQGRAFIEAWTAFRQEMDGLCAAKVRPEETADWIRAMPEFLLRDILRFAVDREVLFLTAMRLSSYKSDVNRSIIANLKSRYDGQMLGNLLGAALIAAGDVPFRKATIAALSSPVFETRAAAAAVTAAAGDRSVFEYLNKALDGKGEESAYAAWVIGRFGGAKEEQWIRNRRTLLAEDAALHAALGELAAKRLFPELYQSFLQQYRFYSDGMSSDGLYETWFILVEQAVSEGASNLDALHAAVVKMRTKPAFGQDLDLWSRRLAAFVDFLDETQKRRNGPTSAQWPQNFIEAEAAIRRASKQEQDAERVAARRIAASIAVLSALGARTGYTDFADPTISVNALSPGGERAVDGNIGTSWHFRKDEPFTVEHRSHRRLQAIRILLWCPFEPHASVSVPFTVSGTDTRGAPWKVTTSLNSPSPVFQLIPIDRDSAKQIQIDIPKDINRGFVCISEIRCQFKSQR